MTLILNEADFFYFFFTGDTVEIAKKIHNKWSKRIHTRPTRSPEDYWEDTEAVEIGWYDHTPEVTLIF